MKPLITIAIVGNVLFILWMTWNGIDEGFAGTSMQVTSYLGLTLLLILNSALLMKHAKRAEEV